MEEKLDRNEWETKDLLDRKKDGEICWPHKELAEAALKIMSVPKEIADEANRISKLLVEERSWQRRRLLGILAAKREIA